MRIFNELIIEEGAMTGTAVVNSSPIWLGHIANWSIQGDWTRTSGTLTGAWKIQVSNSPAKPGNPNKIEPEAGVVWTDLASATGNVANAASGNFFLNLVDSGYLWARVVYTNATGVGVLNVRVNGKGI